MQNNDDLTSGSDDKTTRRMLVADDDPAILRLIATILALEETRDIRSLRPLLQRP